MVDDLMGKATTLAGALDINVPALPPRVGDTVKDSVAALAYLLDDPGPRIAGDLEARHGARAGALFQLATRVNSLLIVYGPDDTTGQAALQAARGFARDAGITEATLDALSSSVSSGASYDEVKQDVFQLHELVERQVRDEG
jgi:hypothetical protein